MHARLLPATILAICSHALSQSSPPPCFETNLGVNLGLGDESVAAANVLGFSFPGPAGPVTAIDIAANGFVWLGSNGTPRCCDGNGFQFTADPPSIAAMWEDLDPSTAPATGGVFFNTFAAAGGALARAVVTWAQVPEANHGPLQTVQLQLLSDGSFVIAHGADNRIQSHQVLVGVTAGNGALANPIVLTSITATTPYSSSSTTAYQEFAGAGYDIAGRSYWFTPLAAGGYRIVERGDCRAAGFTPYGTGCPDVAPISFYEEFAPTTFDLANTSVTGIPNGQNGYLLVGGTNALSPLRVANLNLFDDSVSGPIALPFRFPHPGGSTDTISVSSNGFLWFGPGGSDRAFADHNLLLADPPSLAALWMDLNPELAFGGGVFADADANGQAFYVTWANVPEYNNPGGNTFQIALFANGNFELRYAAAASLTHTSVVGYSTGNGAADPGAIDISAVLPFDTGAGAGPLRLEAAPGSRPRLGTTFTLQTTPIPAGTPLGFMLLGLNSSAIDLTAAGMPGCTGYVDFLGGGISTGVFAVPGATAPYSLGVPNNLALVGMTLFAQSATLSQGFNGLGLIASNGGRLDLGR